MKIKCPVCESTVEISDNTKVGSRITCPSCSGQLALHKHNGKPMLGCAFCNEADFDPVRCDECERRHEKKELLEEGRL